jgi:hypothetical protein
MRRIGARPFNKNRALPWCEVCANGARCARTVRGAYERLAAFPRRLRQERRDPIPLLVGQVRRIALGLLLSVGHPATIRFGPHPKLESRPKPLRNHSQTGS